MSEDGTVTDGEAAVVLPALRDLRYFVVLAEHMHFTKAAAALGISQPTLSQHMHLLEEQLGVGLIDRHNRAMALTVAGRELLTGARGILAGWQNLTQVLKLSARTLRVGMQSSTDVQAIAELAEGAAVQLEPQVSAWVDPTCGLGSRDTDIAVMFLPMVNPERYEWLVLSVQPRWVVLPESHRFAGRAEVRFSDIEDEPFIALPATMGPLRDYWLGGDARGGPGRIGATASSPEERLEAIEMGHGICLIAAASAPIYQFPGIVARPVRGLDNCELALVWRADDQREQVREFVAYVRDRLRSTVS